MCAWYIFSALGFYPVLPGSDEYAIGSPMINEATIQLQNNKTLTIKTVKQGTENVYVQKIEINGKELVGTILKHSDIINGGEITFYLTNKPDKLKYISTSLLD